MDRNVLVDGDNLLHRAQAVYVDSKPPHEQFTSSSGYPTGLVFGALDMLSDWVSSMANPTRFSLFLDGRPLRRLGVDPTYKQDEEKEKGRPWKQPCPITLSDGYTAPDQLSLLVHILKLLGFGVYWHPDEEADDLIASYVRSRISDVNIVVSSDKDFYQLLSWDDKIVLYRPGVAGNRFFDSEQAELHMMKLYKVRVPPANVRMFKALTGDSSDKIVGVPFLRKKVAAPLCHHTSVDDLYATGLPGFSKAEKQKAVDLADRIRKNYEIIGLVDSVDIESCFTPAATDFAAANRILKQDLSIKSIFTHAFSVTSPGRIRTSSPDLDPIYREFL
jgi:5'-3' exonuclease